MSKMEILNPHLKSLAVDHLHHLGLDTTMDLRKTFGDTKFVLMGGSPQRAEQLANKAVVDLELGIKKEEIKPLGSIERCSLFKVGPVLSISHGMGAPSALIFLHEVTKLLQYAGCEDVKYIRVGTSGGLGVSEGTVVVTAKALSGKLEPYFEQEQIGKTQKYKTKLDVGLARDIFNQKGDTQVIRGNTMGTDDFYEGQGRLDGVFNPDYTDQERQEFFQKAYEKGVRNIEMECTAFAAFCLRAKIPAAVVCAVLLDRLKEDLPSATSKELGRFSEDAQDLVLRYIKEEINKG